MSGPLISAESQQWLENELVENGLSQQDARAAIEGLVAEVDERYAEMQAVNADEQAADDE